MKKVSLLVVVVGVAAVTAWVMWARHVRAVRSGPQGDPVRAVESFMRTAVGINGLLWDEEKRQEVRQALEKWQKGPSKDAAPSLRELGIADPAPLFQDEGYGKAAMAIFCMYQFDRFSIAGRDLRSRSAEIAVEFVPRDILGIGKLVEKAGAPALERTKKPVTALFRLRKRGRRWFIVEIGGELGRAIEAAHKLRKSR